MTAEILCFAEIVKIECRMCIFLTRKFPRSGNHGGNVSDAVEYFHTY